MNKLRELRKEKGLTLNELSIELLNKVDLKIGSNALGKYERGEREPRLSTWQKLADYFQVPIPYLLGTSDSRNPESYNDMLKFVEDNLSNLYDSKTGELNKEKTIALFNSFFDNNKLTEIQTLSKLFSGDDEKKQKEYNELILKVPDIESMYQINNGANMVFELGLKALGTQNKRLKKQYDYIYCELLKAMDSKFLDAPRPSNSTHDKYKNRYSNHPGEQ